MKIRRENVEMSNEQPGVLRVVVNGNIGFIDTQLVRMLCGREQSVLQEMNQKLDSINRKVSSISRRS